MAYRTNNSLAGRFVQSREYVSYVRDYGNGLQRVRERPEWSYCDISDFSECDWWRDLMQSHGCTHIIATARVHGIPYAGAIIKKTVMLIACFDDDEQLHWERVPLRIGLEG